MLQQIMQRMLPKLYFGEILCVICAISMRYLFGQKNALFYLAVSALRYLRLFLAQITQRISLN